MDVVGVRGLLPYTVAGKLPHGIFSPISPVPTDVENLDCTRTP